jgi:hypothetical protein
MRTHAPRAAAADPQPAPPQGPGDSLIGLAALRYLQQAPIRVLGPATGRAYAFSGSRPVQMVDARDAEILGRAALFRRN